MTNVSELIRRLRDTSRLDDYARLEAADLLAAQQDVREAEVRIPYNLLESTCITLDTLAKDFEMLGGKIGRLKTLEQLRELLIKHRAGHEQSPSRSEEK